MSSNILFKVPGRTTNYMPIDVNASKEEILEKYARSSFSTVNDWPHESPAAGYYDIKNSDTKLILLNNQKTWSHLRGKTKAKQEPFVKDQNYDWVEKEIELKKSQENLSLSGKSSPTRRYPDPIRHFIKSGCTYKASDDPTLNNDSFLELKRRNKSAVSSSEYSRRSINNIGKSEEEKRENEILLKYLYAVGKRTTGYQNTGVNATPPREFLTSYNINHPEFTRGQRLFINELCSMYSVTPLKESKKNQYIKLFHQQKESDQKHRVKYRMHDGDNFEMYKSWLESNRPVPAFSEVNCGYFKKITTPLSSRLRNYSSKSANKGFKSKSMMIPKPESSLSQSSSFASNSTKVTPQTKEFQSKSMSLRPVTAKHTSKTAKQLPSTSNTSFESNSNESTTNNNKEVKDTNAQEEYTTNDITQSSSDEK